MACLFDCWGDPDHFLPPLTLPFFLRSHFFPRFLSFFRTLSPSSCFLELIFRMISWPQNVLIAESWSPSLQGYFFSPGNSVCVCAFLHLRVSPKRRETRFWGGSQSFKAGVPVILMDVWGTLLPSRPWPPSPVLHLANISLCQTVKPRWGDKMCVYVPKSDIEQGLLHWETSKAWNNTLKVCVSTIRKHRSVFACVVQYS